MAVRTVLAIVLALVLIGCGGPGPDGEARTGAETATEPPPTVFTPPRGAGTPQTDPIVQQSPPAGGTAATAPASTPSEVEWEVSVVADDLNVPWSLAFARDGTAFFTERHTGAVYRLGDGEVSQIDQLEVDATGEGGLLGLTVTPDGGASGPLYAYLTTAEDNRVVRFEPGGEPEVILDGIAKSPIHNGGRIAFGPDGMLYIGTGDAGEPARAQDPSALAGKILRVTADGDVPEDNPFDGSPVWSLGHRNVQGFDWDAEGRMYATEFGPDRDDEINVIEAGGNYGWPEVTGEAGVEEYRDPVVVLQPSEASWSGAAVLVDGAIPQWEGDLFAAALRGERLWRIDLADGEVTDTEALLGGEFGRLRLVTQGPDGALWLATSNRDGRGSPAASDDRILRLGPAG